MVMACILLSLFNHFFLANRFRLERRGALLTLLLRLASRTVRDHNTHPPKPETAPFQIQRSPNTT